MDQQRLNTLLRELDAELRVANKIDARNRDLIERLAGDIQPILASRDPSAAQYQGLQGRLVNAAASFEAGHPRLGQALENVIDALVRLNL